ncbi:MAG TPA: hypothetical protein VLD57_05600, partial [Blastocatellia bacterium]|nr:hypothetical protein [Blastocatellia bacterium]
GENRELIDEIVALGTRFGIVTPYTSFLVTDDMKVIAREGRLPAARRVDSFANRAAAPSGEMAVAQSLAEKELKSSDSLPALDAYLSTVRTIEGKTFILKNGVWIDTEYKESDSRPKISLKFASDEFFALLSRKPDLARFFATGQKVIVVYDGTIYQTD